LAFLALGLVPARAPATWSIVAVDPGTRVVGIAGASCIGGVEVIGGLAPDRGAIAAQALANLEARDKAVELLRWGAGPQQVVAHIAQRDFDPPSLRSGSKLRQYGVVALGFEDALAAFEAQREDPGATLADRLMAALEAGAARGGDKRCSRELTALSAFIAVARPDDDPSAPSLRIVVPYAGETDTVTLRLLRQLLFPERGDAEQNPVTRLRQVYERWRSTQAPKASRARERAQP